MLMLNIYVKIFRRIFFLCRFELTSPISNLAMRKLFLETLKLLNVDDAHHRLPLNLIIELSPTNLAFWRKKRKKSPANNFCIYFDKLNTVKCYNSVVILSCVIFFFFHLDFDQWLTWWHQQTDKIWLIKISIF